MVRFCCLSPWRDPRGGQVERIRIDNGIIAIEVLSLGAIIRSLWAPDRDGQRSNLVLGCDSAEDYLKQNAYLGAIVGRYANRIAEAKFQVEQHLYPLDVNHKSHCLHGGTEGFHRKHWHLAEITDGVRLSLTSADGDMGFPGNCNVQLEYRLVENSLCVEMLASSDKTCPISLTQHSYFKLDASQSSLNHKLQIDAQRYLKMDADGIPNGIFATKNSDLDLSSPTLLQTLIGKKELAPSLGLDHCFLMPKADAKLQRFGRLSSSRSGRSMTLYTNQPGVQVYGGNGLEGIIGRGQQQLKQYQGICLEPQQIPDAPNQTTIAGNALVKPGDVYHHISRYQFDA